MRHDLCELSIAYGNLYGVLILGIILLYMVSASLVPRLLRPPNETGNEARFLLLLAVSYGR